MKRPWQIWAAFAVCLAVTLAAMGWVSRTALRLDRAQAETQQHAGFEENVRLALWRMDSALAPLIARESARPYFTYSAFYPAERAYTRMFSEIRQGEVLVPSPLLTETPPHVLLHFHFAPDGALTSPQVPTGNMRDLAEAVYTTHQKIVAASELLEELKLLISREKLAALLPHGQTSLTVPPVPLRSAWVPRSSDGLGVTRAIARSDDQSFDLEALDRPRTSAPYTTLRSTSQAEQQAMRNIIESRARIQTYRKAAIPKRGKSRRMTRAADMTPVDVEEGIIHPLWSNSALFLLRRVSVAKDEYIQGCRLDWPAVRTWLLDEIADLLPHAELRPADSSDLGRRLAALPVTLLPGDVPIESTPGITPIMISLIVAWACVLLAAIAVAVLLLGAISLSERRGAFVSAVTHELRTPLTTFRIYTEMLEEKMIPAEKRKKYLNTLRREAERLGHLVENVLTFARLERGASPESRLETVSLAQLRDRVQKRLTERAQRAGMQFVIEARASQRSAASQSSNGENWESITVRMDLSAVEQILLNLVDNACKYAASGTDRRIHLEADRSRGYALLRVRDHGPGISPREAPRLFRPFRKSSQDAANSAPGVGLGLALCRRLARNMGGSLQLDLKVKDGACFVLALPRAGEKTISPD